MLRKYFQLVVYLIVITCTSQVRADPKVDFFRAIKVDNARGVTELLAQGVDPNSLSEQGVSALFLALREGSGKVVQALLAHPALRIDEPNANNETPVMMAALHGNLEATRQLLDRGAKLNRPGWTPLHYAACSPEPKVVAYLLDRGADIEAPSPNRTTPLMMAARYGAEDSSLLMLSRGASTSARNDLGMDAAAFARQAAREPLAQRLEKVPR